MVELRESLRRIARYRGVERRLFEILGGWVASADGPEAKLLLARHCYHHAGHAERWGGHLDLGDGGPRPVVPGDGVGDGSGESPEAFLAVAAGPGHGTGTDLTVERLAAVYRVVIPRLVSVYRRHLDEATPVADGPVMRSLRLVIDDEERDLVEGRVLLGSMTDGTPEWAVRAERRAEELERRLAAAGGLMGEPAAADVRRPS